MVLHTIFDQDLKVNDLRSVAITNSVNSGSISIRSRAEGKEWKSLYLLSIIIHCDHTRYCFGGCKGLRKQSLDRWRNRAITMDQGLNQLRTAPSQDLVSQIFRTNSYTPSVRAADGTARREGGVRPPYKDLGPSSLQIRRKHWHIPVYFHSPVSIGACRNLVLMT